MRCLHIQAMALWLASFTLPLAAKDKGVALPAPSPIVYQVSAVSSTEKDQKELLKIFTTVRKTIDQTLTRDEFVRRLKAREHFEIKYPVKCRTCNGWKRLIPKNGNRGQDGKVNCRTCRGRGVEMHPHIVKWSSRFVTHKGDQRDPYLSSLKRELGNDSSAQVWHSTARSYEHGDRKDEPEARRLAHAAYQEAIKRANLAWRDDEPADSDHNRLARRVIDQSLKGIAATAPKREPKPKLEPVEKPEKEKPFQGLFDDFD